MAPAVYIDGLVAFPGFPNELKNMFPKFLKYYVKENNLKNSNIYQRYNYLWHRRKHP